MGTLAPLCADALCDIASFCAASDAFTLRLVASAWVQPVDEGHHAAWASAVATFTGEAEFAATLLQAHRTAGLGHPGVRWVAQVAHAKAHRHRHRENYSPPPVVSASLLQRGVRLVTMSSEDITLRLVGLDATGKTVILSRLMQRNLRKFWGARGPNPTIGFNVETIDPHRALDPVDAATVPPSRVNLWDLGGQAPMRPYWRCYADNTNGVVFTVDVNDRARLDEAAAALEDMLAHCAPHVPSLALANRVDTPPEEHRALGAHDWFDPPQLHAAADILSLPPRAASSPTAMMTNDDIAHGLCLYDPGKVAGRRAWRLQRCSGCTNKGLSPGLAWLLRAIATPSCHATLPRGPT